MLIKCQNGTTVVNMERIAKIDILEFEEKYKVVAVNFGTETLGVYSTKEKANDVINRICSAYDDCVNNMVKAVRGEWIRVVYDMPKDEDVAINK